MTKELCIRCNKPTPYHPNTTIIFRRCFVEEAGQLCEKCFYELYPVPGVLQSNLDTGLYQQSRNCQTDSEENIPNKL